MITELIKQRGEEMTYSLAYLYGNWWMPLIVSVVVAFILAMVIKSLPNPSYDRTPNEFGESIEPAKPKKLTRQEIIMNIFVGIVMVCLIIGIALLVLSKLSDDVVTLCANCTTALSTLS